MNKTSKTANTSPVSPIVILTDDHQLNVTSRGGFYFSCETDAHERALAEACFRALNDRFGPGNVKFFTATLLGGDDPAWNIPRPLKKHTFIKNIYPTIGKIPWDYRFLIGHSQPPQPTPDLPAIYLIHYSPQQDGKYKGDHWTALSEQFDLFRNGVGFTKIFIDGSLPVDEPPRDEILRVKDQLIGKQFSVDLSHTCGYREPMSYDLTLCPDRLGGLSTIIFHSVDELQDLVTDHLQQES